MNDNEATRMEARRMKRFIYTVKGSRSGPKSVDG